MSYPKDLLGKISTRRNLQASWEEISLSAKPQSHGASEQTIKDFRSNLKSNLEMIRKELINGKYHFGAVRAVTIKKRNGKRRPLRIADVRDRVVQRAITRILENYLVKPFGLNNLASHAYRPRKGIQTAIKQMLTYNQEGCRIVLEADIVNFFDSVKIDKLLEMVFSKLPDKTLNGLIEQAFKVEIGNKSELTKEDWDLYPDSSTGLPQGGYLSPLFSNIYLSKFDHELIKANFRLIRYADDFIIMCESNEEAEKAYALVLQIIEVDLGLKLHPRDDDNPQAKTRKIQLTQTPITFLGINFNGFRIWPADEKRLKLSNKLNQLIKSNDARTVQKLLNSMSNLVQGWVSAYAFSDINSNYSKKIDDEINKCLLIALSKLGWKMKTKELSPEQRVNSGIDLVNLYLEKFRINLRDQELFAKYWNIN
jgi:RNA-directed DNA polymerase